MPRSILSLAGTWSAAPIGDDKSLPSGPWEVPVPGTLLASLSQQDIVPNFFWRDQEPLAEPWCLRDYRFTRTFDVPADLLNSPHCFLACEGLDTLAEITINGIHVGTADNMHRQWRFPVRDLQEHGNTITVDISSALRYIRQHEKERVLAGATDAIAGFSHIRKAHCNFGWDWGPKLPDLGIWREIRLEGHTCARLNDVITEQEHHADGTVTLTVTVETESFADAKLTADLALTSPTGKLIETLVLPVDGERATAQFTIAAPALWWPNGYGKQPLYGLSVTLGCADGPDDDSRAMRLGLRTVTLQRRKDEWGESFYFEVNGVPIFCKGANWIPEDALHGRIEDDGTAYLLDSCVDANFNMVRVWGGGHYPCAAFYDGCDERGLLVWQDLMFACALYDLTPGFRASIAAEAEDNIRRLRHHPSLVLICGNNENEQAVTSWGWTKEGDNSLATYIEMFEKLFPEVHARVDAGHAYWPSSPSCGGRTSELAELAPGDERYGDAHYWSVWHGQLPFTDYRKHFHRFMSEFGFQSFPALPTVEGFTLPEDRNIFTKVMENHQKNGAANGKILYYLSETFRYPRDFDSLLYVSQLLQAEAIRCGVEHWRRNRNGERCMGAIYWQLNDNWPVASWASIDYPGRWKALHFAAKRFFAPVLVSAAIDAPEGRAAVHITSDRTAARLGALTWELMDMDGTVVRHDQCEVDIAPLADTLGASLDFSAELEGDSRFRRFLAYRLDVPGEPVSYGTQTFCPPKHVDLPAAAIAVDVHRANDRYQITVCCPAYAPFTELRLLGDAPKNRFSDNYFDLLPGVSVTVDHPDNGLSLREFKKQLQIRALRDSF